MVKTESFYEKESDRIKTQLEFDDEVDERIIWQECEATIACIARFAVSINENLNPSEFLRSVAVDIDEDRDLFAHGLNGEDVMPDE